MSKAALARISEPGIELFFSHAGACEIAIKFGLGKLELPQTPQAYLDRHLTLNKIRYFSQARFHIITAIHSIG